MKQSRGALIVFEGIDRCGKSTQAQLLTSWLIANDVKAKLMKFPDRTSSIGSTIDQYLTKKSDLSDQAIHLLFSADRWEAASQMKKLLLDGTTLVVDRYAFSGVAYSAAKGLSFHWCMQADVGLPKPDAVFFLNLTPAMALSRGGYGEERYEKLAFQQKVYETYLQMRDASWVLLNANEDVDTLQNTLRVEIKKQIEKSRSQQIKGLWLTD